MNDPTPKKANFGIGKLLLLFGALGVVSMAVLMLWVFQTARGMGGELHHTRALGQDFGEAHDGRACIEEGLSRAGECSRFNIKCQVRAQMFVQACLEAKPREPTLCQDVPAPTDVFGSTRYRLTECAKRGTPNDSPCQQLFAGVQNYCARREEADVAGSL